LEKKEEELGAWSLELGAWSLEFGLGRITLLESKASNPSLGAPYLVLKV